MTQKNKTINIRLSEDLHRAIKMKVARDGTTITDYLIKLVKEDLRK